MANFCSGVKVRLFGGAAGSMSSSVTSSFWARSIKGVELVKVMVSVLPVSPWREERLRQVSHVSLTDRGRSVGRTVGRKFARHLVESSRRRGWLVHLGTPWSGLLGEMLGLSKHLADQPHVNLQRRLNDVASARNLGDEIAGPS